MVNCLPGRQILEVRSLRLEDFACKRIQKLSWNPKRRNLMKIDYFIQKIVSVFCTQVELKWKKESLCV